MRVGERVLEPRPYFYRTPNPVRGPMVAQPQRLAFPQAPATAESRRGVVATPADDRVVGETLRSVVWVQTLINCLFRGY